MIDLEVPRMNNSRSTYPCHAIRSLFSSFTQLIPTQHCQKSGRLKQPVWNGPSQRDSDLSAIVRKKGQKANGYLFKASKDLDSFLPLENIASTKKLNLFHSWVKTGWRRRTLVNLFGLRSWMHFCCNIKVVRQIGETNLINRRYKWRRRLKNLESQEYSMESW